MTITVSASSQLQLMEHPRLQEHHILYSDVQHVLIIDGVVIPCTVSEYDVLLTLLRAIGEPVPFAHLLYRDTQQAIPLASRHRLTQRVSRLRGRIWPFGLDILCLTGYGYLLFQRPHPQGASE
jgi:DNA-binding response OmpR family regulator